MDCFRRLRLWFRWSVAVVFVSLCFLTGLPDASAGDADPAYRSCVEKCEISGCVGDNCFQHCEFSLDGLPVDGPWYMQEPLYLKWKQWDCHSDCRYHCMLAREEERQKLGGQPIKYHGKWPFFRVYGIQEPVSVAFSVLNLAMHFHGWISFFILVYYKLPLRENRTTYYEYTGLWHIYSILAMNSCFWSVVFHSRDVEWTEKLDYSSTAALVGYSLILAVLRTLNVRDEAARVMGAAPIFSFVATHILYLNFYDLSYGWNTKVCITMAVAQLLIWAIWASITCHPSRWKLRAVVVVRLLSILLKVYDFPPYLGYIDAHAIWHATTIPVTYLWWSFVRNDAEFRTSLLVKKVK
ncbi:hypothetical protein MLD38_030358 [Melastoma candidum]|uniref:Uncharacterized protein n=1 Tax=Melastoma candidum TaxID=119954 RepID=A0ACB9MQ07_9MYRT|nr:hypothetical protein MLD38_030358 [Melastoma candidum]